jgi:protein-tyrosine-phosphatase
MSGDKKNILFVCKYNRFRSRIAEAYFNKINKNPKIKAKSAGLFKGNPLSPNTIKISKEMGLNIIGPVKGISSKMLAWQNITVIVADDVPEQVFNKNIEYGKKVINLKIPDTKSDNKKEIKKIIKGIMSKIDILNKQLETGKII